MYKKKLIAHRYAETKKLCLLKKYKLERKYQDPDIERPSIKKSISLDYRLDHLTYEYTKERKDGCQHIFKSGQHKGSKCGDFGFQSLFEEFGGRLCDDPKYIRCDKHKLSAADEAERNAARVERLIAYETSIENATEEKVKENQQKYQQEYENAIEEVKKKYRDSTTEDEQQLQILLKQLDIPKLCLSQQKIISKSFLDCFLLLEEENMDKTLKLYEAELASDLQTCQEQVAKAELERARFDQLSPSDKLLQFTNERTERLQEHAGSLVPKK